MATYATDLTTLANADSDVTESTWTEMASPYNAGGTPADDDENLIQGTNCQSQTTGTKSGLVFSIVFDNSSGVTWTSGEVFLIWSFYAVRSNLDTIANGGLRAVIGATTGNADAYDVGGSDDPYASGWKNVAVDPEKAHDYIIGSGAGTTYRYIGMMPKTLASISKGTPHAVDAIRYGRGEIYCTGTGCTFTGMATYNDYNDVTNGYNRWGLFQLLAKDTYLQKGLLSFGQSGTSATLSDSNKTILIDDTPAVTSGFNKIEVNHASTSVTLDNVTFTSLGTTSPGAFEMVDNATFNMTAGGWNNLDTFTFDTNATLTRVPFTNCGQITHGGATFDGCAFSGYEGTAGTAYVLYAESVDPDGEFDDCSFTKGTIATHAIEFDATNTPTTITLRGIDFSGYNATNGNNDSALYFPSTSKSYTVNLVGCTGDISYRVGSGGSVTLVINPVSLTFKVKDSGNSDANLQGARVLAEVTSGVNFPYQASVSITGASTTATVAHTGHGLSTGDYIIIRGANEDVYNGVYSITVTGVDAYTYTTTETIGTSPATGTITATFALLSGTTDVNGEITDSWSITSDQAFSYRVAQGTTAPYFIRSIGSDTLESDTSKTVTLSLIRDQ